MTPLPSTRLSSPAVSEEHTPGHASSGRYNVNAGYRRHPPRGKAPIAGEETVQIMDSTAILVSLDEYLNTSYEPDMEFVDGVLVRRNVGTQLHGLLQAIVGSYLRQFRKSHRIQVFMETRLLVDAATGRHRIPDVMVLEIPYQKGKIVTDVPAIVIEIKSPDDSFDDIIDKCFEYERLGIGKILVMDPDNKRTFLFEQSNLRLLTGASVSLNLHHTTLDFSFAEMFAELDEE